MNKPELEALLQELDEALVKAFPGPEPLSVLVVGGACLLFQDVITRPTEDVDVIIFEMLGSEEESTLIFHSPIADKIRRIIKGIGKRHGLRGDHQMFFNDDCSPFLADQKRTLPTLKHCAKHCASRIGYRRNTWSISTSPLPFIKPSISCRERWRGCLEHRKRVPFSSLSLSFFFA